jgi:hypothetical protein
LHIRHDQMPSHADTERQAFPPPRDRAGDSRSAIAGEPAGDSGPARRVRQRTEAESRGWAGPVGSSCRRWKASSIPCMGRPCHPDDRTNHPFAVSDARLSWTGRAWEGSAADFGKFGQMKFLRGRGNGTVERGDGTRDILDVVRKDWTRDMGKRVGMKAGH